MLIKCWWLWKCEKPISKTKYKKTPNHPSRNAYVPLSCFVLQIFLETVNVFVGFLLPLKIFGVPTAPSCAALVKIKSAPRHVCITFYAGFFTMCHCMFWSFSDSAGKVWYFHADSSLVLLPGVKSCAGYVSVFLFVRFWGRNGAEHLRCVLWTVCFLHFTHLTFIVKKKKSVTPEVCQALCQCYI